MRSSCSLVVFFTRERDASKMLLHHLVYPTPAKSQTPGTPLSSLHSWPEDSDHLTPALGSTKKFSSMGAKASRENDLAIQTLCAGCNVLELNCVPVAETPFIRAVTDELSVGRAGSSADCVRTWDSGGSRYTRWSWRACWRACWWRAGARAYWEGRSNAGSVWFGDVDGRGSCKSREACEENSYGAHSGDLWFDVWFQRCLLLISISFAL